jgi:hypothetical protein
MAVGAMALPASASAQTQEGLVNINISDNVVQVPIGIAANVCDVNAAVLAQIEDTESAECTALADSDATITAPSGDEGPTQDGLINVNISGNTVQVPVAAALNLCDVNIAVLAVINAAEPDEEEGSCDATAGADARGPGNGNGNPNA